jgi:glycosyltransferase involved in cell wall biosynthesis
MTSFSPSLAQKFWTVAKSVNLTRRDSEPCPELSIQESVELTGYLLHDDLPQRFAGALAFVFASSCENCPNTLLEAMACGVPVVTSNRSTLPEIVGDAGLTVDPQDIVAVAQTLRRVLTDDAHRAELAQASRARAQYFSWEKTAVEIRGVFEEVGTSVYVTQRKG